MKLIELRAENFKRLSAVRIAPKSVGATALVGKNGAGKTSVLDAIECALGGAGRSPDLPIRAGQTSATVVLDLDEIVVRRKWTARGSTLEVEAKDGSGLRSPQAVLDKLVGSLSFDPLAFGRMKAGEQAATLARLCGADLDAHRAERQRLFDKRAAANRVAKEVRSALALQGPVPADTPTEEVSVSALLDELKAAEKSEKAFEAAQRECTAAGAQMTAAANRIKALRDELAAAEQDHERLVRVWNDKSAALEALKVIDPEPIRQQGREAEQINRNVRSAQLRANREREVAAKELEAERLSADIDQLDSSFTAKLVSARIAHVPGLALTLDGTVTLHGIPFGQCSGAERLRLSVAIGLALNPRLKLMLIRDGSLLDDDGMRLLAEMAETVGAQILIERVDTGREVGIRIVDGETEDGAAELKAA